MSNRDWIVGEHRGMEGFAALERDWRRLYEETPNSSMPHAYEAHAAYLAHLCPSPDKARFITLSDGTLVRAILPIEERLDRSFAQGDMGVPMRVWAMPWNESFWISDAIGPEDDARRALIPAALAVLRRDPGRPSLLVLGRSWDGSGMWDGLACVAPWMRTAFADGAEYVMPTDMSVDDFMSRMSRKSRAVMRQAKRRFEALEGARYVRAQTHDDAVAEFARFLEVEASGWKGQRGTAIGQRTDVASYYRGLLQHLSIDGHCEIHSLHAEGRCIASAFCVYAHNQVAVYKSGYDESYSLVSPGRLNNHIILERACEDPALDTVTEVSDAPWVLPWVPVPRGMRRAYVALRPVSGPLLITALRVRFGLVRRVARMIKVWRRDRDDLTSARRGRDAVALDTGDHAFRRKGRR